MIRCLLIRLFGAEMVVSRVAAQVIADLVTEAKEAAWTTTAA